MAYSDVFGGELLFPSQLSYLQITTGVDITLQWPREQQIGGTNVVADFLDISTSVTNLNIDFPSASATSTGNKSTINNIGAEDFTVRDSTGGTIQQIQPGQQWVIVLTDNTTAAGVWSAFQLGAATTFASAAALAGAGLQADGFGLLEQIIDSDVEAATPVTVVDGDRAKCLIYTAGSGTADLPSAGTVGNNWFFMLRNSGSGTLTVDPGGPNIDGAATIDLDPNDSCFIFTDGSEWYTVGLSSGSVIAFDFTQIGVGGSGDRVLTTGEQNRISYRFTGTLTGNRRIVTPTTTQQYWVDNQTTGAFTLEVISLPGSGVIVPQGESAIVYCDGTDIINAVSSTSVTFPITVGQGGTGATNATDARTNLNAAFDGRILTAGSGISGGGDLTADRTFTLDVNDLSSVAPATGDFLAFEDIDGGNTTEKATISDILALGTVSFPVDALDNDQIRWGTGQDVSQFFDGTDMRFDAVDTVSYLFRGGTGASEDMLQLIPNGANQLYFDGVNVFSTTADGGDFNGTVVDLINTADTTGGYTHRNSTGGVRLTVISGGNARIDQTSSVGGGQDIWMLFNRDGAVESRFNNAAVARTLAAASGGMEVNNTSTGAGFERVLTTSDLVSSGVPIAYASLRRTGNQSIATGTPTQVSWDATVAEDPGTWFTSGTDLNVPSGVDAVAIAATIRFDNSSAGGSRTVTIERNNAPVNSPMSSYTDNGPFDATADTIVTVGPIVLSVTGGSDTLQIEVFQDTGGNLNIVAGCIVSVWAVG